MTFQDFTKAINEKRQDIKTIIKLTDKVYIEYINGRKGYEYTGTYCEILKKLNINAMYKRDFEQLQNSLQKDIDILNNPEKFKSIFYTFEQYLPTLKNNIKDKQKKIDFYLNNFVLCDG
jgi:hypothetical protein